MLEVQTYPSEVQATQTGGFFKKHPTIILAPAIILATISWHEQGALKATISWHEQGALKATISWHEQGALKATISWQEQGAAVRFAT